MSDIDRVTEDGATRVTEDGSVRVLEEGVEPTPAPLETWVPPSPVVYWGPFRRLRALGGFQNFSEGDA